MTLLRYDVVMTTISIVHTKGGVGKTTTALYLAAAAAAGGRAVVVLDADPQGSAADWADAATAAGSPLPYPVRSVRPRGIRAAPNAELTVIDTPPGTAGAISMAIDAADLVVIPTGVSPLDVRRVWPTLEVTAHRPTAVLLTAVDLRTSLAGEVRALLDDEGVPVISTPVVRREAIRRTYGAPPTNLYGYDDVLDEILEALDE